MPEQLHRRELIKITAGAVVAARVGVADATEPRFFSRDELAMVDELTETIIPADDHSPGARAAQVAPYLDMRLAETDDTAAQQLWKQGLKLVDALSQQLHQRPFLQASAEQRAAVLQKIASNEANPKTPEENFFRELKQATARAYYTSKIGIHTEMEYKGNTYLKEFVGYEVK